jgi:hypothetical protein
MSERSIIENKIKRKTSEIQNLERKIEAAKVYVQALNDVLKEIDRESNDSDDSPTTLRKGSAVAQAYDVIKSAGEPVHIDDILTRIGKEITRESKASLTSSLAAYVRREEIFTRPAPNTFGLTELGHFDLAEEEDDEPPEGFGKDASTDLSDEIPF